MTMAEQIEPFEPFEPILEFWFQEITPKQWFGKSVEFDQIIRQRFFNVWEKASQGELAHWRNHLKGRLAEIIVLDQFSRNLFRDNYQAFSQDPMALVLAQHTIEQADFVQLNEWEKQFILMPFMHSESKTIHQQAEQLFKKYTSQMTYEFELKHKNIIDKFGRYPHRNNILGRKSTNEELEFLKQENSSF